MDAGNGEGKRWRPDEGGIQYKGWGEKQVKQRKKTDRDVSV